MGDSVIITVAPTGGWGKGHGNPVTPEQVASAVNESAIAGASVAHLHSRDRNGTLTADLSYFSRTVELIRAQTGIVIEASTGGLSELSARERALPASHPEAEIGSLNIGSLNFGDEVYKNSVPDVRYWVKVLRDYGAKPTLEIFDTGHLETARYLIDEGLVSTPANFNFIFGVRWGMPFDLQLVSFLTAKLPPESHWGATFVGSTDFTQHVAAANEGALIVRAGFEDSMRYHGTVASSNGELVTVLREELLRAGFAAADPGVARTVLLC